ncbi:MAG: glycolate oxidase subunit GlcF [Pseudomonadota bacterium]
MQTRFTPAQLSDPDISVADEILRKCVHCGFCTATCPTYVLLGDENDSPRGRIYLIKDMLEGDKPASPKVALHIDRCLSCLSCMTTCPSGVHYMHLVDHARERVAESHPRPADERWLRRILATVLPDPRLFRLSLWGARLGRPFMGLMPSALKKLMLQTPARLPTDPPLKPGVYPAQGRRRSRVALLAGCVQQVLGTDINAATVRLLNRLGVEVVVSGEAGCCGALVHHMGDRARAEAMVKANVAAWDKLGDLDAVVINASGCGTMVKDYGFLLRGDPEWAERAARIAALTKDVTEFLASLAFRVDSPPAEVSGTVVAYHSACSLQHGQRVREEPKALLRAAGFTVKEPAEGHLCCGSAGTYSITQPEISRQLRDRKAANLEATRATVVAAGNIGCIEHIRGGTALPIVHTVQLLDWASGGPRPAAL